MNDKLNGKRTGTFIVTREHRRFGEFADAVRKHRYIGVCVTVRPELEKRYRLADMHDGI